MPTSSNNLLVIVGYGSGGESDTRDASALAETLSAALNVPVETGFLETSPSVGEGIQNGVEATQPGRVVVVPIFLGASTAKKNNFAMIVDGARDRWSDITVYEGKPLGTHDGVIRAYGDLVTATLSGSTIPAAETALLVVGRGSRDADTNAEVYQMARLLWEAHEVASVEVAFYGTTKPDIAAGIKRCVQTGAKRIIVLPYLLCEAKLYGSISARAAESQPLYPEIEISVTAHLTIHDGIIEAIRQRYEDALTKTKIRRIGHSHVGITHAHNTPTQVNELQAMLPPRYQGDVTISAAPMGAADLVYDAAGQVAWDEIWGDFCDLALAGGPPHRGTLLEPVTPDQVAANPARYQAVLAELERGIRLVTGLPVVASRSAGWIGIQCDDEAMALWLLRAIIVENISVRREDTVLYLPAGPDFRLEGEIKNVITVVAKTHHYWKEHASENVL